MPDKSVVNDISETRRFAPAQRLRAAGTLFKGEVYVPLLLEDEDGMAHGNDWARGFMRGMGMRHDGWAELVNDEINARRWLNARLAP